MRKNEKRFTRLEKRIEVIERNETDNPKRKREDVAQPAAWKNPVNESAVRLKVPISTVINKNVVNKNQEDPLKPDAVAKPVNEKDDSEKIKNVKLGDSHDLHDQEDWAWSDSDEQWPNTVDRREKNMEKKRKAKLHKAEVEKRVFAKARCIIGLGPIYTESIDHFYEIVCEYDEGKKMAAQEYLRVHLRFDETEIEEMTISDTQISAKGENILYVVMPDERHIRDVCARFAQCRDSDLQIQDFIPPQIYKRYMSLSRYAKEQRDTQCDLKTQIRYGTKDIELWTKIRGTDDMFSQMNMEDVERTEQLPKFDHSVRWTRKKERPSRRQVSPTRSKAVVPSLRRSPSDVQLTGRNRSNYHQTSASKSQSK